MTNPSSGVGPTQVTNNTETKRRFLTNAKLNELAGKVKNEFGYDAIRMEDGNTQQRVLYLPTKNPQLANKILQFVNDILQSDPNVASSSIKETRPGVYIVTIQLK